MTPWDCVKTDQILLEKMSNGASVLCPCETHQHDTGAGATLRIGGHCRLQICRVIRIYVLNFVLNFQIDEMTNKIFELR